MRKILFPILIFSLVFALVGCGQAGSQTSSPPANQINSGGATNQSTPGPATSGTLIAKPQSGVAQYLSLVQKAQSGLG